MWGRAFGGCGRGGAGERASQALETAVQRPWCRGQHGLLTVQCLLLSSVVARYS